ncbi:MAG: tetratricopeptide repeat protein [Crocinitomicaceae bacterium]
MKSLLLLVAVAITSVTFSQKGNTSSAGIAWKNFKSNLMGGDMDAAAKELADAKDFIDKSFVHEDTKDDPKTLMYYGMIYFTASSLVNQTEEDRLNAIDPAKAKTDGLAALKRSIEVDTKERYSDDVKQFAGMSRDQSFQMGLKMYEEKKWDEASQMILMAADFGDVLGISDSSYYYYGGIAAYNGEKWADAESAFTKTAEWGYEPGVSVYYLSQAMQKQERLEDAEKMIKKYVQKYPGNKEILIEMVNIYIDTDRKEQAVEALNEAIALDPNNVALVFTAGTIYENMEDFENAEKQYLKALEMDPKDVNSLSAIGGLYFNKGADVNNAANKLEFGDPNYDKMVAESKDYFKKSVPYLEQATEAKPEELTYWIALRDAYGKAGDVEKFKTAKAKVAELQGN